MVSQKDKDAPKPDQHFVDAAEPGSIMVIDAPRGELAFAIICFTPLTIIVFFLVLS